LFQAALAAGEENSDKCKQCSLLSCQNKELGQ